MSKSSEAMFRVRFARKMESLQGIPGPTPSYPFGNLLDFRGRQPWDVLAEYRQAYGGMALTWFGGSPRVVINDADLAKEILITKFDEYYKDYPIRALRPVLKNTLFVLNPPEWNSLRPAHPCFVDGFDQWLPTQFPVVKEVVDRHLKPMLDSGKVDVLDRMQRMIFEVLNACVIGPKYAAGGGFEQFYIMSEVSTVRMNLPQWMLVPTLRPTFHRAMRLHYGAYERAVQEAHQDLQSDANDLLHVYLRHGSPVSDEQLVTFLSNFQAGGDISAAAAVVNTLHLLSEHPNVADELYDELTPQLGTDGNFDAAALERCSGIDYVLRESLRLLPPVPLNSRNVSQQRSTKLGGFELPPDTTVLIVKQALQRDPEQWKDGDAFQPGRWANGTLEAHPIGSDYFFPFGRGPRMCPGATISMFCMKIILASMLSQAKVRTSGKFELIHHCGVAEAKGLLAELTSHAATRATPSAV